MQTTTTKKRSRGKRWDDAPEQQQKEEDNKITQTPTTASEKAAALKNSIKERLAALKRERGLTTSSTDSNDKATKRAKVYDIDMSVTKPNREKDNYIAIGTSSSKVTSSAATAPAAVAQHELKEKQEESVIKNPYLSGANEEESNKSKDNDSSELLLDSRLVGGKVEKKRTINKQLNFITPGSYIAKAEKQREKAEKAFLSGYISGRKEGTYIKSIGLSSSSNSYYDNNNLAHDNDHGDDKNNTDQQLIIAPRFDGPEYSLHNMPCVLEWWDMEYVPSKLRKQVATLQSQQLALQTNTIVRLSSNKDNNELPQKEEPTKLMEECYNAYSLKYSKTSSLIQHPTPIKPPNYKSPAQNAPETKVYLTKREIKRQRKLRRAEKAREQQDLQAAGVIPPPEPRLTLSNFMKVMGESAIVDPSTIERKVMEQIQARKLKHEKMNADRKLTPKEKSLKKQRKLAKDTNTSTNVSVALFYVKDMSHVYHRTKIDLNAIQLKITGGVLECETNPTCSLVIAEGGPKAIKKFIRLMCVRMKWKGTTDVSDAATVTTTTATDTTTMDDNHDTEAKPIQKFNQNNTCNLLWNGLVLKKSFHTFMFQTATNSDTCKKILQSKGCNHYWDILLSFLSSGGVDNDVDVRLNLVRDDDDDSDEDEDMNEDGNDE